jgi:hypothetical protein
MATTVDQFNTSRCIDNVYIPSRLNRRSRRRFALDRRRGLIAHLGREPTYPERLLIGRTIALEWLLMRLDARIENGQALTESTFRSRVAAERRLRLDLTALGASPRIGAVAAAAQRTLADLEREERATASAPHNPWLCEPA